MPSKKSEALPTPKSISNYVTKNTSKGAHSGMIMTGDMHHSVDVVSMREDEYKDHKITVKTTYHIEVDGRPVTGHIDVSNEGTIAYHGLPNMSFDSAVDLVKMLIDQFPDDFPGPAKSARKKPDADMPGMAMRGMKTSGKKK
jgi:hypothetical protein